jgi:hypothetical protein
VVDFAEHLVGSEGLDIATLKGQSRVLDVREIRDLPRPQVVDHDQALNIGSAKQAIDQMGTNKSGAAGHQH